MPVSVSLLPADSNEVVCPFFPITSCGGLQPLLSNSREQRLLKWCEVGGGCGPLQSPPARRRGGGDGGGSDGCCDSTATADATVRSISNGGGGGSGGGVGSSGGEADRKGEGDIAAPSSGQTEISSRRKGKRGRDQEENCSFLIQPTAIHTAFPLLFRRARGLSSLWEQN